MDTGFEQEKTEKVPAPRQQRSSRKESSPSPQPERFSWKESPPSPRPSPPGEGEPLLDLGCRYRLVNDCAIGKSAELKPPAALFLRLVVSPFRPRRGRSIWQSLDRRTALGDRVNGGQSGAKSPKSATSRSRAWTATESFWPQQNLLHLLYWLASLFFVCFSAQCAEPDFKVIAFYTGRSDQAHISFVKEANRWFPSKATENNFSYTSTTNWDELNGAVLRQYQVILFLDTRPETTAQREAFKSYMEHGGAWMGFHFAGFALTPSDFPQNWDWYHNDFLGAGSYVGNTWRPTSAVLRVENRQHPVTRHLPETFKSAPNEWYKWSNDLRTNADIAILLSIDPSSFPLGTGPKPHEIWHDGYYPVVWTNKRYRMIYFNMGHNDIDYEHKTNKELSSTFSSETQNRLILESLLWLGRKGLKQTH